MLLDDQTEALDFAKRNVDLESGDAERSRAATLVVEERGAGAKDALGLLLVVDGEALASYSLEVVEELVEGAKGLGRVHPHAGLGDERAYLVVVHLGEDRLAGGSAVGRLALAEGGVEPNRTAAVDAFEEDRVAVLVHRESCGHPRGARQLAQRGEPELADGGLLADEVAQAQEAEPQSVARTDVEGSQQPRRCEGARERECGALGHAELLGHLGDPQSGRARVGHELQEGRRPGDRLDTVTIVRRVIVRHRTTQYGNSVNFATTSLDARRETCLDVVIITDKRFVMPNRRQAIAERSTDALARANALRERHDAPALLATRPGTVNWITGGLSDPIDLTAASDPVWALVSDAGRTLITTEIEAPRLANDFDVASLGWELVGVPWFEPSAARDVVAQRLGRDVARVLCDSEVLGVDATAEIVATRMVLSAGERDDLRELGRDTARALACGIDSWRPGSSTDFEVAGEVARELERVGAKAVCLIVGGDDRLRALRHPLAIGATLDEAVMAVVVARRGGLHVATTRLAVRRGDDPIVALVDELEPVNAAVLAASTPAHTWGEAVDALAESYRNAGHEGAWREHYQGGPIAFEQREFELAPGQGGSPYWDLRCELNTALAWNPSLRGGAKIEDTYLVGEGGLELVTVSGSEDERVKVVG